MTRNSIGQFIAALRKANGMTQQELADRLNVSNKAVSRWERDECAPDISLIPSLAEMFGVTCDELLKGQRIFDSDPPQENDREKQEKKAPKVQKQIKGLIGRTLSGFKTWNYISLSVSMVGLICMFGISYGFYRPIIAFAVMLLFEVGALFLGITALSRAKAVKADNELFEEADDILISKFNNTLGSFSFASFFAVLSVVSLALPLMLNSLFDNAYGVLYIGDYFRLYAGVIVLFLALVLLKGRKPYYRLIVGGSSAEAPREPATSKKILIMDIVQYGLFILIDLILMAASYFKKAPDDDSVLVTAMDVAGYICLAAFVIFTVLFLIINRKSIKTLILPAIRNIFLVQASALLGNVYSVSWFSDTVESDPTDPSIWEKTVGLFPEYIWYAVVYTMLVFAVYYVIKAVIDKVKKPNTNT